MISTAALASHASTASAASSTQPGATARPDGTAGPAAFVLTAAEHSAARRHHHGTRIYHVRSGETLSGISGRFCGTPADYPHLAAASGIGNANLIYPAEVVKLACHAALSAVAGVPVASQPSRQPASSQSTVQVSVQVTGSVPTDIAKQMLSEFGWGQDQFGCLYALWQTESGWNPQAENPSSGAFGIPQALPGSKMASAGADWATNPATQIRWGLGYIRDSYGSPCGAEGHEQADGWY